MKTTPRWRGRAKLLALGLILAACSQPPGAPGGNPPAGPVGFPWTDGVTLDPADPYAGGRTFPWRGPGAPGETFLSDVDWTPGSAANGWGPIEKDRSNREQRLGDGGTLTIGGQTYTKGLGMHADGEVSYALGGTCSTFNASVGIDDEVGDRGSVVFQVWSGSTLLYDSGVRRGTDGPQAVSVPVSGVQNLRLVVTDGGDGIGGDHADWGDARVSCPPQAPTGDRPVSDLPWSGPSNGWGPIEKDRSNGEQGLGDGGMLTIGGQTYSKGLGMHAGGEVSYALGGACSTFSASVGIDDEVGDRGSAVFQLWSGPTLLYDSGIRRGTDGPKLVSVPVGGVQTLRLVVAGGGDGIAYDHADWGDARVTCTGAAAAVTNTFTYSPIADQPYVVAEAQGQVVNGKLYTFGGFDSQKSGFTPTDRAYVYDPAANTWTAIAPMPNRGETHAALTTDGTNIFYAGGYAANADGTAQVFGTREVWRYNVGANTYTRLPDLPAERAAGGLEYLNGELHYFGGTNLSRQDVGDHFVLDLTGGAASWTTAAPLPNPRNHLGAATLRGKIYAIGGARGQDQDAVQQTSVHAYDPATNSWTAVRDLPRGRSHNADTTFVLGSRILTVGGESSYNVSMREVTAYDPASNTWTELTPLPVGREASVADALGQGFIVTGGNQPGWVKSGWRAVPTAP